MNATTSAKKSAMNTRIRYAAYSLVGISIVLTLLLAYPEVIRSKAKAHAGKSHAGRSIGSLEPGIIGMAEEGTAILKPADIKTFDMLNNAYPSNKVYWPCGFASGGTGAAFPEATEVIAGYDHSFDAGTKPFPCQERINNFYRGGVWFDLSEISKLPGVVVTSASLHFRSVASETRMEDGKPYPGTRYCANELLVASADWRKGLPSGSLLPVGSLFPPGSFFHSLSELPPKGGSFAGVKCDLGGGLGGLFFCSVDVGPVVNKWVTGTDDNFGFVFKGEEGDPATEDNGACWTRYDNFELTVNYKYDKEPGIIVVLPKKPDTPVAKPGISLPGGAGGEGLALARTNFALAANGGMASASSELDTNRTAAAAINGDRWGLHWGSDPSTGSGWHDGTKGVYPDWLRVDFKDGKMKMIDEIDVFSVQDNVTAPGEPKEDTPFTQYGITDFDVQCLDGSDWKTIASVSGPPNLVWRKFTFTTPVKTSAIRIWVRNALNDYSRIVELEAWGT